MSDSDITFKLASLKCAIAQAEHYGFDLRGKGGGQYGLNSRAVGKELGIVIDRFIDLMEVLKKQNTRKTSLKFKHQLARKLNDAFSECFGEHWLENCQATERAIKKQLGLN